MAADPEVIAEFLSEQREAAPEELQQTFLDIEDFWERKLWHQLTDILVIYFGNPQSASQRLPLFRRFILSFAEKINQLKFVSLGLSAASQCEGGVPMTFDPLPDLILIQMIMSVLLSLPNLPRKSISLHHKMPTSMLLRTLRK